MTIEEKMEHFRRMSIESANNQSAESLSSYKESMDQELQLHKESATALAEESKRALMNQVKANSKKKLSSAQMNIKRELTAKQSSIKAQIFDLVRQKISDYRKTSEYVAYLTNQITGLKEEYKNYNITIYIDPDDSSLLDQLTIATGANIQIYEKQFLGGTRTVVLEKNILVDNSFKTRIADLQEQFNLSL